MGQYTRGDVVIAAVAIDERSTVKTRPAVVIGTGSRGEVYLCPVSSKPSSDAPSIPISLDDFSSGGLDLFGESYVLISRVYRIPCREIIGKKGRLTDEATRALPERAPHTGNPDSAMMKNNRRSGADK
jgi:mRNA interferase MazF